MSCVLHITLAIKHKVEQSVASSVEWTLLNIVMSSKQEQNKKLGITKNLNTEKKTLKKNT